MIGKPAITKCGTGVSSALRRNAQEPLLFLYPAWTRRQYTSAEATQDRGSRRWPDDSFDTANVVFQSRPQSVQPTTSNENSTQGSDRLSFLDATPQFSKSDHTESNGGNKTEKAAAPSTTAPPIRAVAGRILGPKESARRIPFRWTRSKLAYDKRKREDYYAENIQEDEVRQRDWLSILQDLTGATPRRTPGSLLYLSVPEDSLGRLLFGTGNIVDIKYATGSNIAVLEKENDADHRQTLLLSGSSVSVATAAASIFQIVPEATRINPPKCHLASALTLGRRDLSDERAGLTRSVLSSPAKRSSGPRPIRADAIRRPENWTKESLFNYVRSLVRNEVPNHIHRQLYEGHEEHQVITAELLRGLFEDEACWEAMSVFALNESLAYLMSKSNAGLVKLVFNRAAARGFPINVETFNIMLRGAAKIGDIDTIGYLIQRMINMGYWPDTGTWAAFLSAIHDAKSALRVVGAMYERGLLHEAGSAGRIMDVLAPLEYESRLEQESFNLDKFFYEFEKHLGDQWLTISGGNRLLKIAAANAPLSHCWAILEYMSKRNLQPDVVSGNTVMTGHLRAGGLRGLKAATDAIDRLHNEYNFEPDSTTLSTLFTTAWKVQCFGTSRVIWQYACLTGQVSNRMRMLVSRGLTTILNVLPAKLLGDIRKVPFDFSFRQKAIVFMTSTAAKGLFARQETDSSRYKCDSQDVAARIIDMELGRYVFREPKNSNLQELMQSALIVDEEVFQRVKKDEPGAIEWLSENAPSVTSKKRKGVFHHVHVEPREQMLSGRLVAD